MWAVVLVAAGLLCRAGEAISPVEVKGAKLYTADDGEQFFVKGVSYQRGGASEVIDPLVDTSQCELDAGLMRAIGINTIRVYTVEVPNDHDGCMQAFASQGIYVWIDLASPMHSINRADPTYTMDLYTRYTAVVDAFAQYNNTLSFTAANELINYDTESVAAAPYIKAVVRDVKAFRAARGYRKIPISYSSTDVADLQLTTKNYLVCGDAADTIELYGMNLYSWCGNSSYTTSGYDDVYTQFQSTNIPALFSEVGCTSSGPRHFGEVAAILGPVFPATFSGVIVYEWPQEASGYGLVKYPKDDDSGWPSTLADYNFLGSVYTTASPVSTAMDAYTPTNSPPACPTSNSDWPLSPSAPLPTIQALDIGTVTPRTTYYSTAAAALTTGTGSASASTAPASTPSAVDSQPALSTGAIAGIAVGGAVVGIALIGAALLFWRRRRRSASQALDDGQTKPSGQDDEGFQKAELPSGTPVNGFYGKQELASTNLCEADGTLKVHEIDSRGKTRVFEMPGSSPKSSELEGSDAGGR